MPKKARTEEEVNQVKEKILDLTLGIIQEQGLSGFTMRRLAGRMGVKPVTIYRYYESKDHIYLAVLTRGFHLLYQDLMKAYKSQRDPMERVKTMARAYLEFGLAQSSYYNLMFTWHVPKYQDYVGTPMEEAAQYELQESQKVYLFLIQAVRELIETVDEPEEDRIRSYIIYFWSALHGYIAGINNNLLTYMYQEPLELQEVILDNLFKYMEKELREAAEPNRETRT